MRKGGFMKLPKQDSATGRGLKTGAQAGIATLVLTAIGSLAISVWNVPGVPDVVIKWAQDNAFQLAGGIGLSSGLVGYIWNLLRSDVKNY